VNTQRTSAVGPRPVLLWIALILIALEIVGLFAGGIWMIIDRPDGAMGGWGYAVTFAAVLFLFAFLLILGVRALWNGMRWGRGPVVAWQLLQFFTAVTMSDVTGKPAAWIVTVLSLVGIVGLLAPTSRAVTAQALGDGGEAHVH